MNALHLAAGKGHRWAVKMLLIRGASKTIRNPNGFLARKLANIGAHWESTYMRRYGVL